jgi:hypothetical protein
MTDLAQQPLLTPFRMGGNDIKSETIYGSGPEGYVDYPDVKQVAESAESSKG